MCCMKHIPEDGYTLKGQTWSTTVLGEAVVFKYFLVATKGLKGD